jgi:hypothetical protein
VITNGCVPDRVPDLFSKPLRFRWHVWPVYLFHRNGSYALTNHPLRSFHSLHTPKRSSTNALKSLLLYVGPAMVVYSECGDREWQPHLRGNVLLRVGRTYQQGCHRHSVQSAPPVANSCPALLKDIDRTVLLWPSSTQPDHAAHRSHNKTSLDSACRCSGTIGLIVTFDTPEARFGNTRTRLPVRIAHACSLRIHHGPPGAHLAGSTQQSRPRANRRVQTCPTVLVRRRMYPSDAA